MTDDFVWRCRMMKRKYCLIYNSLFSNVEKKGNGNHYEIWKRVELLYSSQIVCWVLVLFKEEVVGVEVALSQQQHWCSFFGRSLDLPSVSRSEPFQTSLEACRNQIAPSPKLAGSFPVATGICPPWPRIIRGEREEEKRGCGEREREKGRKKEREYENGENLHRWQGVHWL